MDARRHRSNIGARRLPSRKRSTAEHANAECIAPKHRATIRVHVHEPATATVRCACTTASSGSEQIARHELRRSIEIIELRVGFDGAIHRDAQVRVRCGPRQCSEQCRSGRTMLICGDCILLKHRYSLGTVHWSLCQRARRGSGLEKIPVAPSEMAKSHSDRSPATFATKSAQNGPAAPHSRCPLIGATRTSRDRKCRGEEQGPIRRGGHYWTTWLTPFSKTTSCGYGSLGSLGRQRGTAPTQPNS